MSVVLVYIIISLSTYIYVISCAYYIIVYEYTTRHGSQSHVHAHDVNVIIPNVCVLGGLYTQCFLRQSAHLIVSLFFQFVNNIHDYEL